MQLFLFYAIKCAGLLQKITVILPNWREKELSFKSKIFLPHYVALQRDPCASYCVWMRMPTPIHTNRFLKQPPPQSVTLVFPIYSPLPQDIFLNKDAFESPVQLHTEMQPQKHYLPVSWLTTTREGERSERAKGRHGDDRRDEGTLSERHWRPTKREGMLVGV